MIITGRNGRGHKIRFNRNDIIIVATNTIDGVNVVVKLLVVLLLVLVLITVRVVLTNKFAYFVRVTGHTSERFVIRGQ